ncbi:GroES-like protein [Xylaria sp. FL0064]|nr:GroES-like protein [Xylaria sp. FL0064]
MTVDSSPVVPLKHRAIIQDEKGVPRLAHDVPVPRLEAGTMLVKTAAVALNPGDYKMCAAFPTPGAIVGMDCAGIIVPDNGAFAEYIRVRPEMLLRVPQGEDGRALLLLEQAATLGVGVMTNIMRSTPDAPAEKPFPVLVYGGSTATGTMATQLLRLSGLLPVATYSPRNFDLVRARGTAAALDYVSPNVHAYDCIADSSSVAHCYAAIGRTGGRYVSLEQVPEELLRTRRAVRAKFMLGYELFGRDVPLPRGHGCAADPEKVALAARHLSGIQGLLDKGTLKTHPVQKLGGGLPGVLEGLKLLKSGSVSGKKLVVL